MNETSDALCTESRSIQLTSRLSRSCPSDKQWNISKAFDSKLDPSEDIEYLLFFSCNTLAGVKFPASKQQMHVVFIAFRATLPDDIYPNTCNNTQTSSSLISSIWRRGVSQGCWDLGFQTKIRQQMLRCFSDRSYSCTVRLYIGLILDNLNHTPKGGLNNFF